MRRHSQPSVHDANINTLISTAHCTDANECDNFRPVTNAIMERHNTRNGDHRTTATDFIVGNTEREPATSDHVVIDLNEMLNFVEENATASSNVDLVGPGSSSNQSRHSHVMVGRGLSQLAQQFSSTQGNDSDSDSVPVNDSGDINHDHSETAGGTNGTTTTATASLIQGVGETYKNVIKVIPFILILLLKTLYDHRLGIGVFLGGLIVTVFVNQKITNQVILKDQRHKRDAILITLFLCSNIFFVYYVFSAHQLYRSLYLLLPSFGQNHIDVWMLLWILIINDFIIKCATMIIKCAVICTPQVLLLFKHRGKYYCVIELVSQFYRSLIPVTPWASFIISDTSESVIFNAILLIFYTICKSMSVFKSALTLKSVIKDTLSHVSYGTLPDLSELKECDNTCPICQDELSDPVRLHCKHIFCDACISVWFDKERTCPMCRQGLAGKRAPPVWRDGATSMYVYLY